MCLAIPGEIIEIEENKEDATRVGRVNFGGIKKMINLDLVPEAVIGDYVLVHVGVAINTVDEAEAKKTLRFLEEMGDLDELKTDQDPEGT